MSKFKRAIMARTIAIIPALIIVCLSNVDAFNEYLNYL